MRRRWKVIVPVVLFIATLAGCDACDDSPTGPSSLTIDQPTGPITMQVGQTATIRVTARVNGELSFASFSSNNSPVATVDSLTGVVRCVAPGDAIITVTGGGTSKTVAVTCTPAVLIDVTPTTVPFTHSVGVTVCPQKIGTIKVTNTSSASVTVTLTPSNPAITLDATSVTIQPGASADVGVNFNCSTQASFSATVSIVASNGAATDTKNVTITATINR